MKVKYLIFALCLVPVLFGCKPPESADTVIEVTGVSLDRETLSLAISGTATLVATVSPADADNLNVSWSSSDSNVATVSNTGLVTGIAEGTATVTVTTQDGSFGASCTVSVLDAYTVSFVTGDGTAIDNQIVRKGETAVQPADPERSGYTFKGWYSDNLCTIVFDFSTAITADTTIFSGWDLVSYSINYTVFTSTYSGNDPVTYGNPDSYTIKSATITLSDAECSSLYFLGWFTDETYTTQVSSIPAGSTGDLQLYAKWAVIISISFNANGGSGTMASIESPADNSVTLPANTLNAPSSQLVFAGWATSSSATDPEFTDEATIISGSGDMTLYAIWKSIYTYSLINGNSEVSITAFSEYFDRSADVTIPAEIDGLPVTSLGLNDSDNADKNAVINLVVPDSVNTLQTRAFYGLNSMETLVLGSGITTVSNYAAYYCGSLTSVTLPDTLTTIPYQMFAGCSSLKTIDLPSGLQTIGERAFYKSGLESVSIPASVTSISTSGVFESCSSLATITVDAANANYKAVDNVLFTKNGTFLLQYAQAQSAASYTVPEGVITVHQGAFQASNVTAVTLPSTLQAIGSGAFSVTSITSIVIPEGVTFLGGWAFSSCGELESISLPDTLTSISTSCFSNASAIESMILPASVTSIGAYAFNGCSSLSELTIEATSPPNAANTMENTFRNVPEDFTILVPAASVNAYKAATNWSDFADRIEAIIH